MRRTLLCCAGAALFLAPLAACGDDDDTTSPPTSAPDDAGGTGGTGGTLRVAALDSLSFDSDSYEVPAGEIHVVYDNEGSIAHTLLIDEVDGFKLSVGDTDEGDVELEPGTYRLYCDVAGHEAGGMVAELTVTG
jgi:plastocyanin